MKTSQALYDAIEAVERLEEAMVEDYNDPETKPKGASWILRHNFATAEMRAAFKNMRDSLNEGD